MNKKSIVSSVLVLSFGLSALPVVHAQQYGNDRRGPPDRGSDQRGDQRNDRGNGQGNGRGNDHRGDDRRAERGAGPNHNYHRGDRLPAEYRGRQYVVDNWREHRLNAPPRGYHWVQTGGDYVLVAIATGVIAQLLLGQ